MVVENKNIKIEFLNCEKAEFGKVFIKNLYDKFNNEREVLLKNCN